MGQTETQAHGLLEVSLGRSGSSEPNRFRGEYKTRWVPVFLSFPLPFLSLVLSSLNSLQPLSRIQSEDRLSSPASMSFPATVKGVPATVGQPVWRHHHAGTLKLIFFSLFCSFVSIYSLLLLFFYFFFKSELTIFKTSIYRPKSTRGVCFYTFFLLFVFGSDFVCQRRVLADWILCVSVWMCRFKFDLDVIGLGNRLCVRFRPT